MNPLLRYGLLPALMTIVLLPVASAFALNPNQIAPDSNVISSDYKVEFTGYSPNTYLGFGTNFYSDGLAVYSDHVVFTNTALGGSSNPTHSFGIGVQSGNATITTIGQKLITLSMSCTVGQVCYSYYYYGIGISSVGITTNSGLVTIPKSEFYTDATSFNSASAPAVYNNVAGGYVEVKAVYSNPTTETFYVEYGSKNFIYADLGSSQKISLVYITKPDINAIPTSVDVYITNDIDNWGTPVLSNYQLKQEVGTEMLDNPNTSGRYVIIAVNDPGTTTSFKLSELDPAVLNDWGGLDAINLAGNSFYMVMGIVIVAIAAFVILKIVSG